MTTLSNLKLDISSRGYYINKSAISGTSQEFDTDVIPLEADEYITGVYALGPNTGAYNNAAIYYLTEWSLKSNNVIHMKVVRGANDHSPNIHIVVSITKIKLVK